MRLQGEAEDRQDEQGGAEAGRRPRHSSQSGHRGPLRAPHHGAETLFASPLLSPQECGLSRATCRVMAGQQCREDGDVSRLARRQRPHVALLAVCFFFLGKSVMVQKLCYQVNGLIIVIYK